MAVTNQQILDAILGLTKAVETLAANQPKAVVAEPAEPKAPARTKRTTQPKAAAKSQPKADLPLTKARLQDFKAAAAKDGVDFSGLSTWDVAYYCVTEGYAPKGFCIGERYTALALEAAAR